MKRNLSKLLVLVTGLFFYEVCLAQGLSSEAKSLLRKVVDSPSKTIPVIVKFDDKSKNQRELEQTRDRFLQKRAQLAQKSHASGVRKSKKFRYAPYAAINVGRSELLELLGDATIKVYEDTLKRPSLAQSLELVYPTRDFSPFHGDNRWTVAVLDTGINKAHAFLNGKVVSEACYSNGGGLPTTGTLCPGGGKSEIQSGSGVPCNLTGCEHGTQVAGIAAGNGPAFDGVARDAKLISIQVYSQINDESFCFPSASCIGAFTSDIISGLERVFELRDSFDIASVNISLGSDERFSGSCDDQPEKPIIDMLRTAGIAVIAASGNSGDTSRMQSPACISSAIAVAATFDVSTTPWSGNNISNQLDIFAPGVSITTSHSNGGFSEVTGTSFAAPHVAGAWAAIKHASPSLGVDEIEGMIEGQGLSVSQHTIARRRLDLTSVLERLVPGSQREGNPPNGGKSFSPAVFILLLED